MEHKMGIIGYGGMGSGHHSTRVNNKIKGLEVVAAYDIDPERMKLARERGLRTFDSVEDFLKDPEIDLVLVATPNNFHKPLAIAAMNAGKNVICEKPVALNSAELEEMMEAAKRNHVLFTVHQNRRWDRDFLTVKKAIEDGMVGKPYSIESRVHGQNGVVHGWRAYKVAGGGMLFDWGVHLLDQLMFMNKEKVTEVYCQFFSIKTPEVDDYFKLLFRFESGLSALIDIGTYCLEPQNRWNINGDSGSLYIKNWDCEGKVIRASQYAMNWEPEIVQTSAGPTRTMAPRPKETLEELPLPEVCPDRNAFYQNVVDAMDGKTELIVKPEEALRVMKVIDAAFWSAENGQSVKCSI